MQKLDGRSRGEFACEREGEQCARDRMRCPESHRRLGGDETMHDI
jgi:hypothetical protein